MTDPSLHRWQELAIDQAITNAANAEIDVAAPRFCAWLAESADQSTLARVTLLALSPALHSRTPRRQATAQVSLNHALRALRDEYHAYRLEYATDTEREQALEAITEEVER